MPSLAGNPTISQHMEEAQHCDTNTDDFYQALYTALPTACIFTSVPLPESSSDAQCVGATTSGPSHSLPLTRAWDESDANDITIGVPETAEGSEEVVMNSDESMKEQQNAESNKMTEVNTMTETNQTTETNPMTETNQMIETNQMTGANLILKLLVSFLPL